jgi:penicillin-binding protein 1A
MGIPNLVTGVWVGNEDRSARFQSITYGQGLQLLPVWAYFMKLCYADENLKVSKGEFERPANLSIRVDCYNAPAAKDDRNFTEYR